LGSSPDHGNFEQTYAGSSDVPSHICRSESSPNHLNFFSLVNIESESSHKNCQVTSSHFFASSSQCRVKRNLTFSYVFFCYEMTPNELQNGAQRAKKWCPMLF